MSHRLGPRGTATDTANSFRNTAISPAHFAKKYCLFVNSGLHSCSMRQLFCTFSFEGRAHKTPLRRRFMHRRSRPPWAHQIKRIGATSKRPLAQDAEAQLALQSKQINRWQHTQTGRQPDGADAWRHEDGADRDWYRPFHQGCSLLVWRSHQGVNPGIQIWPPWVCPANDEKRRTLRAIKAMVSGWWAITSRMLGRETTSSTGGHRRLTCGTG